jgi:dUTP pyrophosphatase
MKTISVEFIKTSPTAILPKKGSADAVGYDLYADGPGFLCAHESELVETGLNIALPSGFEAQVRSRSGLALKKRVVVLNSPGTIDPDYRGALGIILMNHGEETFHWSHGDRLAQLVIAPVQPACAMVEVKEFSVPSTERGMYGYGSTGD